MLRLQLGKFQLQDMHPFPGDWANDLQLFWQNGNPASECTFKVHAPTTGTYDVTLYLTSAPDYGIVRMAYQGTPIGRRIDLYAESPAAQFCAVPQAATLRWR